MIKVSTLEVKSNSVSADADLVFVAQDAGKKLIPGKNAFSATLEKLRKQDRFTAKTATTSFIPMVGKNQTQNLLAVGVGIPAETPLEKFRHAGAAALAKLNAEKVKTVAIHVDTLADARGLEDPVKAVEAFLQGFMLSQYRFDKYKREPSKEAIGPEKVTIVSADKSLKSKLDAIALDVANVTECVKITRDWSNEPSNFGTPEYFAKEAVRIAKAHGIKATVLGEKEMKKEKMNLLLSVSVGSEREAKVVVLDYHPRDAKKTIALVGKGVTFDSGGISLKPGLRMEEMKHDMTGAATLFGSAILAAKRKVKNRVVTILAFTENMPDGRATQPGNVIAARNGLTVEIVNTDAEGRLILADVLDYAHDFKPDCIVNAATLTGAVVVALGKQCCGIMGTDDALVQQLVRLGQENFERMWQLPLFDEYMDDMRTDCADMKNVGNDGNGGTIRGGIFLKQFIKKGMKWAHLDIAATGWGMGHIPYYPRKGGSGMHVRTVAQFLSEF